MTYEPVPELTTALEQLLQDASAVPDLEAQIQTLQTEVDDLTAQIAAAPAGGRHEVLMGQYGMTNNEAGMTAADGRAGVQIPLSRVYYGLSQSNLTDALSQEAKGRMMVMSFAPRDNGNPTTWYRFADVRDGRYDPDVDRVGALLNTLKRKHYVGFAHEPETLIKQHAAGTLAEYVAAWEHVIGRWKAQGADHLWTPCYQAQVPAGGLPPTRSRIGCDPYCWYNVAGHMGPWVWPETLLDNAIASASAQGDSTTPMLLCETGVGPDPRKGAWLSRLYLGALARPRMEAICYFSTNKEADWRVESDEDSLGAWQAVMKAAVRS